jgi:hypothetical protein
MSSDTQPRIGCRHPPRQISALFAVYRATVQSLDIQSLESGYSTLAHVILLKSEFSDPGSARLAKTMQTLHRGRAGPLCKAGPPPINTSWEAEVMLRDGPKGTRRDATIACRLRLYPLKRNTLDRNPGSRRFPVQYIAFGVATLRGHPLMIF